MCTDAVPSVPRIGRRRTILTMAAGVAAALHGGRPRAWAQGHGADADAKPDEAHDRQKWDPARKADEAVKRARNARARVEYYLEWADEEGWCPQNALELTGVIDALACYLATRDIWWTFTLDVYPPGPVDFAKEFKGREDGDDASKKRHDRAQAMRKAFKDAKELREETLALLARCRPAGGVAAMDEAVQKGVAQKKGHELALVGLAPLLVVDCPECRPRVRFGPHTIILGR